MKITHRIPVRPMTSDEVDADYQAEVDFYTERAEKAYHAALRRLQAAEERAQRVQKANAGKQTAKAKRQIDEAWAVVELRRMELEKYARLMTATGAPSPNRGRDSFRPVPVTHRGHV